MSFSVDVNVLLFASDTGSPHHRRATAFLGEQALGGEPFYLTWLTAMSYLRIATHPRIFDQPLTPETALGNLRRLMDRPSVRMIGEGPEFLDRYAGLAEGGPIRGNLVPDAHLAALLLQHGIRVLYTHDADFLRFRFLEVRDPFRQG